MLSHYLSVAFRQLSKNKLYSAISVVGLGVGIASVSLIYQYLKQETGYDRYLPGSENIYRVAWIGSNPQTRTPHPMALAMVRDFPEVENGTTLTPLYGAGLTKRTFSVRNLERKLRFDESNVLAVDTTFFNVFGFPLVKGNPKTVLKDPGGLLISESMAKKYFGGEEPIGKHLAVNDDRRLLEIQGVFKDVPPDSHVHFDMLVSYVLMKAENPNDSFYSWSDFGHYNYVRLRPGADAPKLEAKLMDWLPKYFPLTPEQLEGMKKSHYTFRLQPIRDIHLNSNLHWELETNGNITYVYIMSAAGLMILIIAFMNFINLTTAQSAERAKEIGIRKSLGAFRGQLTSQFIGESMLLAGLGVILSIVLIEGALPFYNLFAVMPAAMQYADYILFLGFAGIAVGFLAGAYPALYLSMLRPGEVLKGKMMQVAGGTMFRKSFLVFQFFAAMVLISSSLVIYSQLDYVRHKSLGFDQNELIVIPVKDGKAISAHFEELQSELLRIPGVQDVSATSNIPGKSFNQNAIYAATDIEQRVDAAQVYVDADIFKTLGIKLKEGRFFSRSNPADKNTFILNETAARNLYPDGAVGKEIVWEDEDGPQKRTVIGVVSDFHYQSLHEPLRPLIFIPDNSFNYVVARISTGNFPGLISSVERTWKKFDSNFDFDFSFLSDQLNQQYSREQNMSAVMIFFSVLAVLITCIGLLGIAALTFRQRIKEISIRKVLGATMTGIAWLLLNSFTRLVLAAVILAVPFVWWLMNSWLNNFSFRTVINPFIFAGAAGLMVAVTWGTLSFLTLRIAKVNPAETLKAE